MIPGIKIAGFPRKFLLGPGVLGASGKIIKAAIKKPLVVGGRRATAAAEKAGLFAALEKEGIPYVKELFGQPEYGPECCEPEINRLTKIGQENGCDGVIAIGGGKVIDAGKAVALNLGGNSVIVPTIAATDAPTSALSVIYTTDHVFQAYWFQDWNPAAVIVDSKVIAEAPARYLAGGMGDAFSKKYEGLACVRTGSKNLLVKPDWIGGSTDLTAMMAEEQYRRLLKYGELAMDAVRAHAVTPALEAIIETNILWSGIAFESTGLAAAHSVHNGLTALEHHIPEEKRPIHGELVAFGAMCEMVMEDWPKEEIIENFVWLHKVGLPINFREIGFKEGEPTDEDLWKAAEKACAAAETIQTEFFMTYGAAAEQMGAYKLLVNGPELVFYAMKHVDQIGQRIAQQVPRVPYEAKWVPYDAFIKKSRW